MDIEKILMHFYNILDFIGMNLLYIYICLVFILVIMLVFK